MIVYLGLGSNIDAEENINKARGALAQAYSRVRFSRTFESSPLGFEGDNFLNLVAEVETNLTLGSLIEQVKAMEDKLGRLRDGIKFSSRHIDIDILLYGDTVCQQPIVLPREEIRYNAYVLWPLAELAPKLKDPLSGKSYAHLWRSFNKELQQLKPLD